MEPVSKNSSWNRSAVGSDNVDRAVVDGFGEEWSRFRQTLDEETLGPIFESYFRIFPWDRLPPDARGFDLGCGSGRWGRFVAQRTGSLVLIDPSAAALAVAEENLRGLQNVEFLVGAAGNLPLSADSFDFGYSLGVLHHTPNPAVGLADATRILRSGAPMLVYLYYALDNRGWGYRALWRLSDFPRRIVSRLPRVVKQLVCDIIAVVIYWPLARLSKLVERVGGPAEALPLSAYRDGPFYTMRTDALDRFGTRLELRFTRAEVIELMESSGLVDVLVSDEAPFWCAVGFKGPTASAI